MFHVHEGTHVLLRCSFCAVQESHAATHLMVHVDEVTYMLLRADAFAATLLMVHVHEVTYVLLRCAPCGGA